MPAALLLAGAGSGSALSLGSLATGAGIFSNVASGIGNLFGKGDSNARASRLAVEAEQRSIANQQHLDLNRLSWLVKGAKRAGIHPLHAIGLPATAPASYSASAGGGADNFSRFAAAGADISRALHAGSSNMERLQERLLETQIQGQEIDNVMRASEVARVNAMPGSPPAGLMLGEKLQQMPHAGLGLARGVHPLHVTAIDEKGRPIRMFNTQDLGDNEIVQALHALRYTFPDWIDQNISRPVDRGIKSFFKHGFKSWRR